MANSVGTEPQLVVHLWFLSLCMFAKGMRSFWLWVEVTPISTCAGTAHRWLRGKAILCEWAGPLWWALSLQEGAVKSTLEAGGSVCKGTKWVYSGTETWSSVTGVQSMCVHLVSKDTETADGARQGGVKRVTAHKSTSMVFPTVMFGYEIWTIKKTEHWRIDAFHLWCWRRLLRVLLTARGSNQSILKEINPDSHWKDWCWSSSSLATWCKEPTH